MVLGGIKLHVNQACALAAGMASSILVCMEFSH